jgi:nucleotide-binding universal stress UspA family protein
MTYATIHLQLTPHPVPTSLGTIEYANALANLFEAKLALSSAHLRTRAPQNWIVGAMMSTMARKLKTFTTAQPQALEPHLQAEAVSQGIPAKITQAAEYWRGGLADNAWPGRVRGLRILGLSPNSAEPRLYVEDWLIGPGRPGTRYSNDRAQQFPAESVPICWYHSQSAAHTVSDALPFLHNVKRVRLAVFRDEKYTSIADPTTPLVTFLADHGVKFNSEDVAIGKQTIGVAILEHVKATDAYLILMGTLGRSRLREFLLGGAKQELLAGSSILPFVPH